MQKENKGENYLKAFPNLKKWINECVCCHKKGYKPELPDKISIVDGAQDVYYLKKYFKPLHLNSNGLCKICEKLVDNS